MAVLKAFNRKCHAKSTTKSIRMSGQVPAVVYGHNHDTKSIKVDSVELLKTVRDGGRNAIISLHVENGQPVDVILHDYQTDPIKDKLIHADFYIVNMTEEMDVDVPLHLTGDAFGVKEGGVLQQPYYELQVRARPGNIPEKIEVDVTNLKVGDSITIGDIPPSSDYQFRDETDVTIATVVPPDTLQDIEEAPDDNQEPDLVDGKGDDQ